MTPTARITADKIAAFTEAMRENVLNGETAFRRAYIRSVIDEVQVDDAKIRIIGRKSVREKLVVAGGAAPSGVPSFVRKWRVRQGFELLGPARSGRIPRCVNRYKSNLLLTSYCIDVSDSHPRS